MLTGNVVQDFLCWRNRTGNLGLDAEWDEELRLSSWIDLSSGDRKVNSGQAEDIEEALRYALD